MKNIPEIVYHYCSLESFLAIIKNSTIRLTNITKSNDRDEIRYCFDAFEDTLRKSCKQFSQKYIDNIEVKNFFDEIDYDSLVSRAVVNESLIYYVACFSSESDLLSQWRGYKLRNNAILGFVVKYIENNAEKLQGKSAKEIFNTIDKSIKENNK